MSIEAVIAFLRHEGARMDESVAQAVERASRAGYAFEQDHFRAVAGVHALLDHVRRDEALRSEVLAASSRGHALHELARRLGTEVEQDALAAVLASMHPASTELDDTELDQVSGGSAPFRPEVADEVLVGFLRGDVRAPIIVGSLWNSKETPPG